MLKKRVMGVVVVRHGIAVQSLGFERYLPVGRPEIVVEALDRWGVDEISVIDITATRERRVNVDLVRSLSRNCQVPLTYGGGIRSADDMTTVVQAGADKVMINDAFRQNPELVQAGAALLGNQCIVVSVDVTRSKSGALVVHDYLRREATNEHAVAAARRVASAGAGELFVNFVHRDGVKTGYDIDGVREIADVIDIPLTICGGVGRSEDLAAGLDVPRVSAVAAANFWNFTEHSVTTAKRLLTARLAKDLRQDTYFDYHDAAFDQSGRLAKKDDAVLKELLFEFHAEEVI